MKINRRTAAKDFLAVAGGAVLERTRGVAAEAASGPEERIRTQVCGIGGGSGGIGAALPAARGGAKVVLLERESSLGGTSTGAWIHTWEPVSGAR